MNIEDLIHRARACEIVDEDGRTVNLGAVLEYLHEALLDSGAHLVGAASAYRRYARRGRDQGRAWTDPFYTTRVEDFARAAARAQAVLRQLNGIDPQQEEEEARSSPAPGM